MAAWIRGVNFFELKTSDHIRFYCFRPDSVLQVRSRSHKKSQLIFSEKILDCQQLPFGRQAYVCLYVCPIDMFVCMYVCMYVCVSNSSDYKALGVFFPRKRTAIKPLQQSNRLVATSNRLIH
jgi:hypothetical protein